MHEPTPEMIEAAGKRLFGARSGSEYIKHEVNDALKAALAAAPSPWRPIAEAPWNVTVLAIAAVKPEHVGVICLRKSADGVRTLYGGWPIGWKIPTHFMEIPAPPETGE